MPAGIYPHKRRIFDGKTAQQRYASSTRGKEKTKLNNVMRKEKRRAARQYATLVCNNLRCGQLFVAKLSKRTTKFCSERCKNAAYCQGVKYKSGVLSRRKDVLIRKWKKELEKWQPEMQQARLALAEVNRSLQKGGHNRKPRLEAWPSLIEALKQAAILPT